MYKRQKKNEALHALIKSGGIEIPMHLASVGDIIYMNDTYECLHLCIGHQAVSSSVEKGVHLISMSVLRKVLKGAGRCFRCR